MCDDSVDTSRGIDDSNEIKGWDPEPSGPPVLRAGGYLSGVGTTGCAAGVPSESLEEGHEQDPDNRYDEHERFWMIRDRR